MLERARNRTAGGRIDSTKTRTINIGHYKKINTPRVQKYHIQELREPLGGRPSPQKPRPAQNNRYKYFSDPLTGRYEKKEREESTFSTDPPSRC